MKSLLREVRYAVRVLGRNRGFALTAAGTLALGIGATTAIFSVLDACRSDRFPSAKATGSP